MDNEHEHKPQHSGGILAPVSAMRPRWQFTNEDQDQDHEQQKFRHACIQILPHGVHVQHSLGLIAMTE